MYDKQIPAAKVWLGVSPQQVDYMWEDLHREFVAMDLYSTGFVSAEEFRDVLSELCVNLSNYELQMLTHKFDIKQDGRWGESTTSLTFTGLSNRESI